MIASFKEYNFAFLCHRNRSSAKEPTEKASQSCSRKDFLIDLRQIFGNRLIAPITYNAYTCSGKCELTTDSFRGPFKNHAAASFMMNKDQTESEPAELCCVPSAYTGQLILYDGADVADYVLRDLPNMVVSECSCVFTKKASKPT